MVVVDYAAVRADRNVNTRFLKVFVSCLRNFDKSGRLTPAYTFLFTRYTNASASDTHFYEIRACLCKEQKSVFVYDVAGADFNLFSVLFADKIYRAFLPDRIAFAAVDTQYVGSRFDEFGHPFFIIQRVNTCAYEIAFLIVEHFERIFFMFGIVFSEHEINEFSVLVHNGELVKFMFPNYVVRFGKVGAYRSGDQGFYGGHKRRNFGIRRHSAYAVISACDQSEQNAVAFAVVGYGNRGVTRSLNERKHVSERTVGRKIAVAHDEPCFMIFYPSYHRRFALYRLIAEDEGQTAFLCESDSESIVADRLHYCRSKGDIKRNRAFFSLSELNERR